MVPLTSASRFSRGLEQEIFRTGAEDGFIGTHSGPGKEATT
jgi:hypothetical protein